MDLGPLITLQLNYLSHILIVDQTAVARELLLERLEQLLGIVLGGHSLQGRDRLATVSLLDSDVDVGGGRLFGDDFGRVGGRGRLVSYVGECVC